MDFFARSNGTHPIRDAEFIWVATYYDGSFFAEYDLNTLKDDTNRFYQIDKNKLIRFGLVGFGSKMFFEVATGVFNVNGHEFRLSYVVDDTEYNLTGRTLLYNDIIQYKDAVSEATPKMKGEGAFSTKVLQYNFGYKKKFNLEGVDFNYQAVMAIPQNQSAYLQIKIATDKDLDGKLRIRRNGVVVDEFDAPLQAGVSGKINWTMR